MHVGEWWHSIDHDEPCRIVESDALWGQASCVVWLPRRGSAVSVPQIRLAPLKASDDKLLHRLSYVSAAARIADALERDALVAPLEGSVIPLPHQLHALQRTVSGDRIRYLLADEVAPLYYDRGDDGIPKAWVEKMRRSITSSLVRFSSDRMVAEYLQRAYLPLARG